MIVWHLIIPRQDKRHEKLFNFSLRNDLVVFQKSLSYSLEFKFNKIKLYLSMLVFSGYKDWQFRVKRSAASYIYFFRIQNKLTFKNILLVGLARKSVYSRVIL